MLFDIYYMHREFVSRNRNQEIEIQPIWKDVMEALTAQDALQWGKMKHPTMWKHLAVQPTQWPELKQ